jgi:hypothetical protein
MGEREPMSGIVKVKQGVEFSVIAPGGFVLLAAIVAAAKELQWDLTITSACDGEHSGPEDPHHRGEAYDLRTRDVPDPGKLLRALVSRLEVREPGRFFAFIEDPDTDNEHIHCQVKKGTSYPPPKVMTA